MILKKLAQKISRKVIMLKKVSHLHDELISNLDVNSLALNIARNIGTITRASSVSILQVRRSGERNHLVAAALNVEKDSKAEECLGQTLALDQRLLDCLLDLAAESRTKSFPVEEVKETFDETTFLHEDTSQVRHFQENTKYPPQKSLKQCPPNMKFSNFDEIRESVKWYLLLFYHFLVHCLLLRYS